MDRRNRALGIPPRHGGAAGLCPDPTPAPGPPPRIGATARGREPPAPWQRCRMQAAPRPLPTHCGGAAAPAARWRHRRRVRTGTQGHGDTPAAPRTGPPRSPTTRRAPGDAVHAHTRAHTHPQPCGATVPAAVAPRTTAPWRCPGPRAHPRALHMGTGPRALHQGLAGGLQGPHGASSNRTDPALVPSAWPHHCRAGALLALLCPPCAHQAP